MFKSFFANRRWLHWSALGSAAILIVTWYKVQLDVRINEWFGDFYDTLQKALAEPGAVQFEDFLTKCLTFAEIAGIYVTVAVLLEFFVRHYVFRWRTAMNDYYMSYWHQLRHIEGSAQRVQEDTMRFARIVEGLGVAFMRSVMTLVAFLPLLWVLSEQVTELPWIGKVDHSLVYLAIISAAAGTVLLAIVGIKLPAWSSTTRRWKPRTARSWSTARTTKSGRSRRRSRSCSRTCARTISGSQALSLLRHREVVLSPVRGHRALHHDGSDHRGGDHHTWRAPADSARVRPGRVVVPVSRELVGDDRRADLDLQAR